MSFLEYICYAFMIFLPHVMIGTAISHAAFGIIVAITAKFSFWNEKRMKRFFGVALIIGATSGAIYSIVNLIYC